MLLVIFGAAMFVSCVCCWGDMMAIRRVSVQVQQSHRLLESLRSRLMQDNYDYEAPPPSAEGGLRGAGESAPPPAGTDAAGGGRGGTHVTRRFAIVKSSNSTVSSRASASVTVTYAEFVAKAREETSVTSSPRTTTQRNTTPRTTTPRTTTLRTTTPRTTTPRATNTTKEDLELITYPFNFSARAASSEGIGYEALFDDIRKLLNQTENDHKNPKMPAETLAQDHGVPVPNQEGKLTLKNIEDLEFKFLRVRETDGFNREGHEHVIVTSKDGIFPEIKLSESRRQYMESESEDATDK